jgi:hypothetical protein
MNFEAVLRQRLFERFERFQRTNSDLLPTLRLMSVLLSL